MSCLVKQNWLALFFCACNLISGIGQSLAVNTLRDDGDCPFTRCDSVRSLNSIMKHFQLHKQVYLSIGGDARYQYFKIENEDWGETPESSDGFLLARHLLYGNLQIGRHWRIFNQLQSGVAERKQMVSAIDDNKLEIHQLFGDYKFNLTEKSKGIVRLGRQEVSYGSQRLVSVRNGPNTRQSFDGIRSIISFPLTKFDLFFHYFVRSKRGTFNDILNNDVRIWGSYITRTNVPLISNVDIYYIGLQKSFSRLDDNYGRELRHSFGLRLSKMKARLKYDIESVLQRGNLGGSRITAWTISVNTSYAFESIKFTPQLGLKTEMISGDRRYDDRKINTFNPLFPSGAYFGLAALFGPANLIDVHPSISLSFNPKVTMFFDYDIFWRMETSDGIYTNNNTLIYTGRTNSHKYIGQQLSAELSYSLCKFASAKAEFKWFDTGQFLKAAGKGKDILFLAITIQCTF